MTAHDSLRAEVEDWLRTNWNPNATLVEWRNRLVDSGWAMPTWPERWYGRGLSGAEANIVADAFAEAGAVGVASGGPGRLAAVTILEHGTDAQKEKYLRRILTGEDLWCQLFSEPGSGSDLAGATTRADRVEEGWRINGQKVWNTSAHHARYGLLVARTDWDVPKHQGLSYFILDMDQPGVTVKQLKQMNGHASFNEVFFTDARVPDGEMLGNEGDGWKVAMTTLAHERRMGGDVLRSAAGAPREGTIYEEVRQENAVLMAPYTWYPQRAGRVDLILPRAVATGRIGNPVIRQEIARTLTLARTAEWTARRARAAQQQGKPQGPEGSLGKLAASNVARAAARVHTMINGTDTLLNGPTSPENGIIAEIFVSVPAVSIAGGTDEIQRNIIAERVLGMDKEPRFDQGPFRDVRRN
ncbi:MAG: acyl-CoA dehydrogenase family protein [Pseudomonadales bacterium]|jgi:alkylation response protein AidB-like acyl-CoA dehydrogenase